MPTVSRSDEGQGRAAVLVPGAARHKGTRFTSLSHFVEELAAFECDDLDLRIHSTTQERRIDRFVRELEHLTPLPERRFVSTRAMSRKVSWDCLVSYQRNRYSVPATYAGKLVWLPPSRGSHVLVLDAKRDVLAEHQLSASKGSQVTAAREYYASHPNVLFRRLELPVFNS